MSLDELICEDCDIDDDIMEKCCVSDQEWCIISAIETPRFGCQKVGGYPPLFKLGTSLLHTNITQM